MSHSLAMTVFVDCDGRLRFVYDDELLPLLALGESVLRRASHVEPAAGGWTADLSPSQGPVLGPFVKHRDAIGAEREWLSDRMANEVQ